MARPRTPIGTFGDISYIRASGNQVRARTRYRDDDGKVRRVSATGGTRREAERNLKKVIADRSSFRATGELTAIDHTATGGNFKTSVLAYEFYVQSFRSFDTGLGAALGVLIFILVIPIVVYNVRQMRKLEAR